MNQKKYLWTLYLIITTIVISISTQIYFNYKSYQKNKQQFVNEVQISLDNAVDNYFAKLAKEEFIFPSGASTFSNIISLEIENYTSEKDSLFIGNIPDSILHDLSAKKPENVFVYTNTSNGKFNHFELNNSKQRLDSLNILKSISSVFVSVTNNSIPLEELTKLVKDEFERKKIQMPFVLNHFSEGKLIATNDSISKFKSVITTTAKSTYLKEFEKLELAFPNQTKTYLKKGLVGIFLSLFLALAIIASLFYLLNIIKKQKIIAEIKNDFISNITHEFKTPITTIGLAIASIREFNKQDKKEKTQEYLDITNTQLQKLNLMVEKVLETSVLDSEQLLLHRENVDMVVLLKKITNKYRITNSNKTISLLTNHSVINYDLDLFHFENAINNLIDNAIKYGGNPITISLSENAKNIELQISDSGNIPKAHRANIFDKFYRIPQGDRHDIKGFGIGLYYTQKIIEKHQGTITLLDNKTTTFKIVLPK